MLKNCHSPELFRKLKRDSELKQKENVLKKYITKANDLLKRSLKEYFIRWWKISYKEDRKVLKSKCRRMNLNNLKKIILINPIDKYYRRWVKNMIILSDPKDEVKKTEKKLRNV